MEYFAQYRLLLLLRLFYDETDEDHTLTAAEIVRHWAEHGIPGSRRNVYADVEFLISFGVDIICRRERQNRYFLGSRLFELPELKLLVDAVESSRFMPRRKSDSLIEKLSRLTSREQRGELHRPVYMDDGAKPANDGVYYIIDVLHTAVREKRQVKFQYIDYTPQKEKVYRHDGLWYYLSPYALIWSRDYYYAVGRSKRHAGLAQFRVDRIVNAEILAEGAVPMPDFDPSLYAREIFGMYPEKPCRIELLCENSVMRSVIDRFGENVDTQVVDGGHFIAAVEAAPSPPFFAWVFTFGGKIQIVSPSSVLQTMREMGGWLVPRRPLG